MSHNRCIEGLPESAAGDGDFNGRLSFSSMYPQLRMLARARLRAGRETLLDTTSLVHEFYIRLAESGNIQIGDWPQFLRYASCAMRNIIVDAVRPAVH